MIKYEEIRSVHLEISTRCNAACPECPRNFHGVNILDDFPLTDLKLEQVQQIFPPSFIKQLTRLYINGNYGDFVTASDGVEIVEYFRSVKATLKIEISTNASAKPKIWARLGELKTNVLFRLDGLKDTHHLYRQNTDFDLIIENAKNFIAAGGYAVWAMIPFDHNQHQIEECKQLAKKLGFAQFLLTDAGRNSSVVFNKDKVFTHIIGNYQGSTNFDELYSNYNTPKNQSIIMLNNTISKSNIDCYSTKHKEIYVSANGEVYPCCWMGFYPNYSPNSIRNLQIAPLIHENNALEVGLESAVKWFDKIDATLKCDSVKDGRLYICNEVCGG
jgi:MoaA/NifB/PqqE/SkfB family radical SAM enzyme